MGYAIVTSRCFGCGKVFSYNPIAVPSINIQGTREPVCADCVTRVNPMRVANGLEPILPRADAYEPCDESELR